MSKSSASWKGKRVLWIVPKWPLPAHDGARIAISGLIREVARLGIAIDLVSIASPNEDVRIKEGLSDLGVRSVAILRREEIATSKIGRIFQVFLSFLRSPRTPVTMRVFGTGELRSQLRNLLMGRSNVIQAMYPKRPEDFGKWDAVIFDVLHPAFSMSTAGVFRRSAITVTPLVVYRAHNRESDIWSRRVDQAKFFLSKWFLGYQARLVEKFENSVIQGADVIAAVSAEELKRFQVIDPRLRGEVVPIGQKFRPIVPPSRSGGLRLMFLGKLDWPPNRDGLTWFLQHVWPKVLIQRPDSNLEIAGSGDASSFEGFLNVSNVTFLGRLPEVRSLYERCDACIVPIFYGGGTRVKAIEASSYGRACISTRLGVEGLGLQAGENVVLVESEQEWVERIATIERDELADYGDRAYESLKEKFSEERAARSFCELLFSESFPREVAQNEL